MTESVTQLAVSVVIPTHNPRADYLARVLEALRLQTLPREQWEVVVIDNGSRVPLKAAQARQKDQKTAESARQVAKQTTDKRPRDEQGCIDPSWHPHARVVREEKLGLTFARLRGFAEAKGDLIVMVDDDNVLASDYLETAVRIAEEHPMLGAFGGKCLPEFEHEPPAWLKARGKGLGLRDRGEAPQLFPEETGAGLRDERLKDEKTAESRQLADGSWQGGENGKLPTDHRQCRVLREFPECAPIGAGMVLRREAAVAYAKRMTQLAGVSWQSSVGAVENTDLPKHHSTETPNHRAAAVITDRRGDSLASGGDNDICLTVIEEGWQVGYLPQLQLTHLIAARRMTLDYHKRMARDSMMSFILMLDQHGIRPWPSMPKWTLPLRVVSDWLRIKPWQGPEQSLRFWGNVGLVKGRAALSACGKSGGHDASDNALSEKNKL